ncbi:thiamine pyrophosphate-dependent acetolactate synthase large subunit-like protein [Leucobacter luti]|uniref:thiamine pyrophosphate-binding protein n=1 Tax=Leucobacter luti TaxID=340320 RepID=UPI0010484F35|nr:thiamine pyrophosphate-binding protein [Leucobacter luti]MCW2288237.1 thiamine pyrophosphate-dependent acetolactate synthase large subunit-like protein [Leucobacter luti]TCK45605.1 thiamine pyrophosphate-dependent acetolactate synthase large subunit-like protein [Leucobacter luti]
MSTPATLTRTLAEALARHAERSFGLMGNGNAHLIDNLSQVGVTYTAVRHEAATVAAADAYSRVSGKLAIATTTYGAGFTNMLTALAEAAQARTPMLVVVGDAPSAGPRPWDVDQEMLAAALGVRTHMLSVTNIERTVERAVSYAERFRRPVVLGIPYDLVSAPSVAPAAPAQASTGIDLNDPAVLAALSASVANISIPEPARPETDSIAGIAAHQVQAAVRALLEAERPHIIAGRGAHLSGASLELGRVAEALGALTSTTALGRGIFPAEQYDLGITGGFGQIPAMETIAQADVVLVVGAALNQFTMRFGDLFGAGTTVIRIDTEQVAPPKSNLPITHILLQGDARATLTAMLGALETAIPSSAGWRTQVAGLELGGALRVRATGLAEHPDGICADGRLDPRAVAVRIGEQLPANRHVTTDGGHFIGWANMYWPVASPERMIMVGTAYQTIGLGFPTVAGVAAAVPDTTIVLSTGDGGGLMALADLETAIRTSASTVIVVWNDGAYGAEVHLYGVMGLDEGPMLIPDVNFAGLATALGAQGVLVESLADLDALGEWTAAGATGTILLDCRVSRSVVAEYQREIQRVNGLDVPEE